ncbi:MAG: hypothetical protein AAGI92_09220 [Pseudomonadota bacterium]
MFRTTFSFVLFVAATLLIPMALAGSKTGVKIISTEGAVTAVLQTPSGSFIETTRGPFRITEGDCDTEICLKRETISGSADKAPRGAVPDGKIAVSNQGDIRRAWYARPTQRYQHCILGDCIEGGSLVVENGNGEQFEFVLPQNQVFEDLTPRLADLDGDPETTEVVTIRASTTRGAAVVIYGLIDGVIREIAASSENGRPNRWLAIAAIVDQTIYFVRTPHIGGRFSSVELGSGGIVREANDVYLDVSNHLIGSRVMMSTAFANSRGEVRVALPSQDRTRLAILGNSTRDDVNLPEPIDKAIIAVGNHLVTATESGQLLAIKTSPH